MKLYKLLLLLLVSGSVYAQQSEAASVPSSPSVQRQQSLLHLLREDCGACHGRSMRGGLGSSLTVEALQDKPTESLVATILYGRPTTAMPPWQAFVNEGEAQWMVEQLKSGLPAEKDVK